MTMDDVTRHPDDEVLFDLVDGSLDDAAADLAQRHLARCSACAAFVRAATDGADALAAPVDPMPAAAAESLHLSINAAWRDRRDAIAADEQATPVLIDVASTPLDPATDIPSPPRRRRARRLLPVLAFAVLATLAGTSIYIGQQPADEPTVSVESSAPEPTAAPSSERSTDDARKSLSTESTDADIDAGAVADAAAGAAASAPAGVGGDPYDDLMTQEFVCIASRDEFDLTLPDGRIPQQILRGPLGIYVVCG